jgi:hypothetical protein
MPSRRPLTGVITIDWVDAADPDDADPPSNFGWSMRPEPMLDDQRLILPLREIANTLEEASQPSTTTTPTARPHRNPRPTTIRWIQVKCSPDR